MNRVELNSRGHQPPIFPIPSEHDSDDVESATLPANDLNHGKAAFDKCEPPWVLGPKPGSRSTFELEITCWLRKGRFEGVRPFVSKSHFSNRK